MKQANEYEVVIRLRSGREETVRQFAWSVLDAVMQAAIETVDRLGAEATDGQAIVAVRPPLECCVSAFNIMAAFNQLLNGVKGVESDEAEPGKAAGA